MYNEFIQNRISKLRTEKDVSAREMSLSIGQHPSYINQIENKRSLPSMEAFLFICEYLGVTPAQFFDEDREMSLLQKEIIDDIFKLTQEDLQLISSLIKRISK